MNFRKLVFYIFSILSSILIILSLLSLIEDVSLWYIKILDFPRLQYLVLGLIFVIILIATIKDWSTFNRILVFGLVISVVIQAVIIFPYTAFASKEVSSVSKGEDKKNVFSLLVANVWMKNNNTSEFLELVVKNDPDIVITMEVNSWWIEEIDTLEHIYPFQVKKPYDNTYGMAIYSRFPLSNTRILYLNQLKVPSIHTQVKIDATEVFNLHAVHPVPPKPSEYPDNIGQEEVALLKVGNMVADEELPSVVAGDFNDVAWSKMSRLFQENGELNDIRVGRGFYNTFNAQSYVLRWPLDHVYVTEEFKVVSLHRLSKFGSDHFPFLVKLQP